MRKGTDMPGSRLSDAQVREWMKSHSGWRLEQGELRRTFEFKDFKESLAFVNRVGELAEKEKHHPDIHLRYRRVTIALVTYDLDGVSDKDVRVAEAIDKLV